ncbi:MAG TPA: hypothetical protein PKE31_21180 [Pseudomonadota bacterium]|nr:hypothetical protein [Pseudomonadota bacterium]
MTMRTDRLPSLLCLPLFIAGAACADSKISRVPAERPVAPVTLSQPAKPSPAAALKPAATQLKPQPMRGPFPDLRAYCKDIKQSPGECFVDGPDSEGTGYFAMKAPQPPFRGARLISTGDVAWRRFALAIQVAKGWYVQDIIEASADAQVRELSVDASISALGPLVRLRLAGTYLLPTKFGSDRTAQNCFEQLALCGMGRSEVPSCIPPLTVANAFCKGYSGEPPMPPWDWQIKVSLQNEGQLDLAATGTPDFITPRKYLGTHRLQFP